MAGPAAHNVDGLAEPANTLDDAGGREVGRPLPRCPAWRRRLNHEPPHRRRPSMMGHSHHSPESRMTASLLTTMVERLDVAPRAPLYTFLDRHGKEVDSADCEEIVRRAAGTADLLQAAGVGPGDRVLLIFPPGWPGVRRELLRVHAARRDRGPGGQPRPAASRSGAAEAPARRRGQRRARRAHRMRSTARSRRSRRCATA